MIRRSNHWPCVEAAPLSGLLNLERSQVVLWEFFQMSRIERSRSEALDAQSTAREAQGDVRQLQLKVQVLEQQCERLNLAAMAMAEILRDRLGVTEKEIEAKLTEIDLRDGQLDGKLRPSLRECSKCQRTNAAIRQQCLYCGAALTSNSFLFQSSSRSPDETLPGKES